MKAAVCLQVSIHVHAVPRAWATWYNTWLLIELIPKGIVFFFFFVSALHAVPLLTTNVPQLT